MKRTFTLLFITMLFVYGYLGYQVFQGNQLPTCANEGSLSDIAETVTAIPLTGISSERLASIRDIRRDGGHIFLFSQKQLLHFTSIGQYVSEIGYGEPIEIKDYAIDPDRKQLIVLGSQGEILYYTYEGVRLAQTVIAQEKDWRAFGKLVYYNDCLWATVERIGPTAAIEQWLYRFDRQLRVLERRRLHAADVGRPVIDYVSNPQISVADGKVYVQGSSAQPDYLLDDTLHLLRNHLLDISPNYAAILPLQIGSRFLLASDMRHTFCFDRKKNKVYQVAGGLEDDFYQTGSVAALQPLDIHNRTYWYVHSGTSLRHAFPETEILFFVKMKA